MLITIAQILLEYYQDRKAKRAKKLRDFRLHTRVQELPSIPQSKSEFNKDSSFFEMQSSDQGRMNSELVSFGQESFDFTLSPHEIRPSMKHRRIKRPPRSIGNSLQNQESPQEMATNYNFPQSFTQQGRKVRRLNVATMKSLPQQSLRKED